MKKLDKDEELFEKYFFANKLSDDNENKINVLNLEKIKSVINYSKKKKINKLTVTLAENKIKKYYDGLDQRYITLGTILDISLLLDIPITEMFIDGFLENLYKTNSNK